MHIICVTPFGCSLILNFMILLHDTKFYDQFPEGYAKNSIVTDVVCVTAWLLLPVLNSIIHDQKVTAGEKTMTSNSMIHARRLKTSCQTPYILQLQT